MILETDQTKLSLAGYARQIKAQFDNIRNLLGVVGGFVWSNPNGKTPQQVFDLLGTDAAELVRISGAAATLIQTLTGQAVKVAPDGVTLTSNADGTVTVGAAQ